MSVAEAAGHIVRVRDPGKLKAAPPAAGVAPPGTKIPDAVQSAITQITTYIPTTVVGAFVGLSALLGDGKQTLPLVVFFIFWALTPLAVIAATRSKTADGSVVLPRTVKEALPALAATIAFAAWAAALPGSTLSYHASWLTAQVGGVMVVVTSVVLGSFAAAVNSNAAAAG